MPDQNEELLKRIRDRYRYGMDKWQKNRDEGQKNMRYVSGNPWDKEDLAARKGRPTVCADELNQYVNQVTNTARQNPRGIKIDPAGDDASQQLAEYRENRIRAIEYACKASRVYINGLQGAVERNIGFWKVSRKYVSDESDEQEIVILPIMNPDSIVFDPDYKELDGSDARWCFELDKLTLEEFEREYPDAEKTSFTADDYGGDASGWFDGKTITIVSYWEVQTEKRKVGKNKRDANVRVGVKQYVTNGLEILHEGAKQPGPYVPIVPVFGKELWVEECGQSERLLLSLVSLARDAQKALAYVMSSMLENTGQLPKTSYIGAVGQFETDREAWETVNTTFHPFLQYDPIVDEASGTMLEAPQRTQSSPDFNSYSVGTDICRRAIQAAMGIAPMPTVAQRANDASGVAAQKRQTEQQVGSYHLVDSYDSAIQLTGRIINQWLPETDLGEASRPVRLADGKHKLVKINTDDAVVEDDGSQYHLPIADDTGRYQVTVSSGPSHESQREEASEFGDSIVSNMEQLPLQPPQKAKILALVVRMKQLGPIGDQIADVIDPPSNTQQQMGQMQQQMAQMQQQGAEMQKMLQELMLERQGKVIEIQGKKELAMMDHVSRMAEADKDREVKLAVAEIETKAQKDSERDEMVHDLVTQFHDQAHDAASQQVQQQHEQAMQAQQAQQQSQLADQQAANASAQSAQDAQQQQTAQPPQV